MLRTIRTQVYLQSLGWIGCNTNSSFNKHNIVFNISQFLWFLEYSCTNYIFQEAVLNRCRALDNNVQRRFMVANGLSKAQVKRNGIGCDMDITSLIFDNDKVNKQCEETIKLWKRFEKEIGKLGGFKVNIYTFKYRSETPIKKRQSISLSDAGKVMIRCMSFKKNWDHQG